MKSIVAASVVVVLLVVLIAYRIIANIGFERNCGGYLERAATANTIPLAKENLEHAVSYLSSNNMDAGYTSILYKTPNEDVGFFYNNLSSSLEVLKNTKADADELTVSNTLLKLHNTLMDQGKEGQSVHVPTGISIFPNNFVVGWGFVVLIILGIGAGIWVVSENG